MEDLWPEAFYPFPEDHEALKLLRQQARLLGRKTDGHVEGEVTSLMVGGEGRVYYSFYLLVPSMGDYRYKLLSLDLPIAGEYPVLATETSFERPQATLNSLDEVRTWMRETFASQPVVGAIGRLMKWCKDKSERE